MGLVKEILGALRPGAKAESRTIGDVETALRRLADERKSAREAIASLMRERDELLLVDETDKKIADLDAKADRHRLTLERCEKLEPMLMDELRTLQSDARQNRWRALSAKYDKAASAFAVAARKALDAQEAVTAIRHEAQSTGFVPEAMTLPPASNILTREILTVFESALESRRESAAPRAAADAMQKARATAPVVPLKAAAAPLPPPPKQAAAAKPRELRRIEGAIPDGHTGVVVLRPGIEIAGERLKAGDELALPNEQAAELIRNRSVDAIAAKRTA